MPAKITITVTKFVASSSTNPGATPPPQPYCTISTPPTIVDDGGGQVGLVAGSNTAIWVKPTTANQTGGPGGRPIPVDIEFTIASLPTAPDNFSLVPTGMRFMQTRGNGDPSGNANFNSSAPVGTAITVSDKWLARGKSSQGNAPKWEFYIAVTDTTSQTSGWIDPGIENTED